MNTTEYHNLIEKLTKTYRLERDQAKKLVDNLQEATINELMKRPNMRKQEFLILAILAEHSTWVLEFVTARPISKLAEMLEFYAQETECVEKAAEAFKQRIIEDKLDIQSYLAAHRKRTALSHKQLPTERERTMQVDLSLVTQTSIEENVDLDALRMKFLGLPVVLMLNSLPPGSLKMLNNLSYGEVEWLHSALSHLEFRAVLKWELETVKGLFVFPRKNAKSIVRSRLIPTEEQKADFERWYAARNA